MRADPDLTKHEGVEVAGAVLRSRANLDHT
jgi:hypothetical protein